MARGRKVAKTRTGKKPVRKIKQNSVWPNKRWFETYLDGCGGDTVEARRRLGIRSTQTWTRYVMGKGPVRMSTLEEVARNAGATLRQVTCRPPHTRLVDLSARDPVDFFLGTWHSVYLDFNRRKDEFEGKPHWWRETITFERHPDPDPGFAKARFRVHLTNAHGVAFAGEALLLGEWQLVCVFVRDAPGGTDDDESIVITFSEKVTLGSKKKDDAAKGVEVLVGSWPGTDRGNANARIYRNLLSRRPLTQGQIDKAAARSLLVEKWTNCRVK